MRKTPRIRYMKKTILSRIIIKLLNISDKEKNHKSKQRKKTHGKKKDKNNHRLLNGNNASKRDLTK